MVELLSTVIAIAAGVVAIAAGVSCALGQDRPVLLDRGVQVLEGALVLRALAGVGRMLGGQQEVHSVTHLGYLVASVAILPVALGAIEEDRSRWSTAVIAVACLAVVVIVLRLEATAS